MRSAPSTWSETLRRLHTGRRKPSAALGWQKASSTAGAVGEESAEGTQAAWRESRRSVEKPEALVGAATGQLASTATGWNKAGKFEFILHTPGIFRRLRHARRIEEPLVMMRAVVPHRHMVRIGAFLKTTIAVVKFRAQKNRVLGRKEVLLRAVSAVETLDLRRVPLRLTIPLLSARVSTSLRTIG